MLASTLLFLGLMCIYALLSLQIARRVNSSSLNGAHLNTRVRSSDVE